MHIEKGEYPWVVGSKPGIDTLNLYIIYLFLSLVTMFRTLQLKITMFRLNFYHIALFSYLDIESIHLILLDFIEF